MRVQPIARPHKAQKQCALGGAKGFERRPKVELGLLFQSAVGCKRQKHSKKTCQWPEARGQLAEGQRSKRVAERSKECKVTDGFAHQTCFPFDFHEALTQAIPHCTSAQSAASAAPDRAETDVR